MWDVVCMCNLYKLMLNQAISRHLQFCTLTPSKSASLPSGTVICRNYNRFIYFTYCTVDYREYLSRRGDSKKPGVCKLPVSEIAFVAGWTHRLVVFSRFSETAFVAGWTHRLVVFSRFHENGFRRRVDSQTCSFLPVF